MLKISHIKIRPIQFILLMVIGVGNACYMPRGAFLASAELMHDESKEVAKITLPIEFQAYNYFRITYLKNKEIYIGDKINDSTIVFIPNKLAERVGQGQFRVEVGIIPFAEKNK